MVLIFSNRFYFFSQITSRGIAVHNCKRFEMLKKCNKICMHRIIWVTDASKEDNLRHCSNPYVVCATNLGKQTERYVLSWISFNISRYMCLRLFYVSSDIFSFNYTLTQMLYDIYRNFSFYFYSLSFSWCLLQSFYYYSFRNSFFPHFYESIWFFFSYITVNVIKPTWYQVIKKCDLCKSGSVPFDAKSISHL